MWKLLQKWGQESNVVLSARSVGCVSVLIWCCSARSFPQLLLAQSQWLHWHTGLRQAPTTTTSTTASYISSGTAILHLRHYTLHKVFDPIVIIVVLNNSEGWLLAAWL